ncbi:hypothetical protein RM479_27470, partial [Nocardiopsis sp. DSM 44743]|nr:hypothetical protein [Nocardiopsis sp. DSM 44743]
PDSPADTDDTPVLVDGPGVNDRDGDRDGQGDGDRDGDSQDEESQAGIRVPGDIIDPDEEGDEDTSDTDDGLYDPSPDSPADTDDTPVLVDGPGVNDRDGDRDGQGD